MYNYNAPPFLKSSGKELLQRERTVLIPGRTAPKKWNPVFLTKRAGKKRFQSGIDTEGKARGTIPEGNEVFPTETKNSGSIFEVALSSQRDKKIRKILKYTTVLPREIWFLRERTVSSTVKNAPKKWNTILCAVLWHAKQRLYITILTSLSIVHIRFDL